MSTTEPTHPDINALRDYLLGKLDALASQKIDQHIERCPLCIDLCDQINDDDDVIDLMRAVQSSASPSRSFSSANGTSRRLESTSIASKLNVLSRANRRPKIPGFEIQTELGRGGMGVVYRAQQPRLNRTVALKTLPLNAAGRPDLIRRLETEAQALARLQHPNILQIFEVGDHEGCGYVALEFVDGRDLHEHLGDGTLSPHEAAEYLVVLANAIHSAHQLGIIHRDLKPRNILIDDAGRIKIADFGLAKVLDSDSEQTRTGTFLGTPAYMAPEQVHGGEEVSAATDVYGLGTIFYQCLTGQGPFDGESAATTLQRIMHTQPISPRSISPRIPRDLETICLKCLEKEPSQRYSSTAALAEDLQRFLRGEAIAARPLHTAELVWRWSRRNKVLASSTLVILTMMVVGLVYSSITSQRMAKLAYEKAFEARRATHLRHEAEVARDTAVTQRDQARWNQYVAEMNIASRLSHTPDGMPRVREITERWRSTKNVTVPDHRGWEWYFLASLGHRERMTFDVPVTRVQSVDWSLDGKSILTFAKSDLYRWSLQKSTKEVFHLQDIALEYSVEMGPHGRRIAIVAGNPERSWLSIRDATTFDLIWKQEFEPQGLRQIRWSPDGTRLVTCGFQSGPIVWDVDTNQKIAEFSEFTRMVPAVSWSPDGRKIVTGDWQCRVCIWDVDSQTRLQTIKAHEKWVSAVDWSPNGRWIASSSPDRAIKLWDAEGHLIRSLLGHRDEVWCVRWSPDGSLLASSSQDASVRIWEPTKGNEIEQLHGHTAGVWDVRWKPDRTQLASSGHDGTVKVWDLYDSDQSRAFHGHAYGVQAVSWSPDGLRLASGSRRTAQLIIWDFKSGKKLWQNRGRRKWSPNQETAFSIRDIGWAPDGKLVAASYNNGTVLLLNSHSGEELRHFNVHEGNAYAVCWSSDGDRLYTAGGDSVIRSWQLEGGTPVFEAMGHDAGIVAIKSSPDGTALASISRDGTIRIWDSETGAQLRVLSGAKHQLLDLIWNPSGTHLATGGESGELLVWDVESGKILRSLRGHTRNVRSVHWTPDGSRLASASDDQTVKIWNPTTGAEVSSLESHTNRVTGVAWNPDGMCLASCSLDRTIRIWDASRAYRASPGRRRSSPLERHVGKGL